MIELPPPPQPTFRDNSLVIASMVSLDHKATLALRGIGRHYQDLGFSQMAFILYQTATNASGTDYLYTKSQTIEAIIEERIQQSPTTPQRAFGKFRIDPPKMLAGLRTRYEAYDDNAFYILLPYEAFALKQTLISGAYREDLTVQEFLGILSRTLTFEQVRNPYFTNQEGLASPSETLVKLTRFYPKGMRPLPLRSFPDNLEVLPPELSSPPALEPEKPKAVSADPSFPETVVRALKDSLAHFPLGIPLRLRRKLWTCELSDSTKMGEIAQEFMTIYLTWPKEQQDRFLSQHLTPIRIKTFKPSKVG